MTYYQYTVKVFNMDDITINYKDRSGLVPANNMTQALDLIMSHYSLMDLGVKEVLSLKVAFDDSLVFDFEEIEADNHFDYKIIKK